MAQHKYPQTSSSGTIELHSLQEATNYLENLSAKASYNMSPVIKGQLEVLKFIESPSLHHTTFDSLILYLKKSLDSTNDPRQKEQIQESFSMMIQNYVFFLNARMQLALNQNKQEFKDLCIQAGEQLSSSIVSVSTLAVAKTGTKVFVGNFFASESGQSIFSTLINYFFNRQEAKKKKEEFYQVLQGLITKLDRYANLIGPSLMIREMIYNYKADLVLYRFDKQETILKDEISEIDNSIRSNTRLLGNFSACFFVFLLGMATILIRWIYRGIASLFSSSVEYNLPWFNVHFMWVVGITIATGIVCLAREYFKNKDLRKQLQDKKKELLEFEKDKLKYQESLEEIAQKFWV